MKLIKIITIYFSFFLFFGISKAGVISDAPGISKILLNILNFLLQIFGIIGIIAIAISGIFYITAFGNEERIKIAKKSFLYSIIGIIVAVSGMVIIKTISGFLK